MAFNSIIVFLSEINLKTHNLSHLCSFFLKNQLLEDCSVHKLRPEEFLVSKFDSIIKFPVIKQVICFQAHVKSD